MVKDLGKIKNFHNKEVMVTYKLKQNALRVQHENMQIVYLMYVSSGVAFRWPTGNWFDSLYNHLFLHFQTLLFNLFFLKIGKPSFLSIKNMFSDKLLLVSEILFFPM